MRAPVRQSRSYRISGSNAFRALLIASTCLSLVLSPLISVSFWLPWAKEEEKIAKRLDEIWAAVLLGDRKILEMVVLGDGAQAFIDQEIAYAKTMKVKSYKSHVEKADIDHTTQEFAFADVTRTATLEDGGTLNHRSLRVLKKIDNDWRLVVDIPKDRKNRGKTAKQDATPTQAKRVDTRSQQGIEWTKP